MLFEGVQSAAKPASRDAELVYDVFARLARGSFDEIRQLLGAARNDPRRVVGETLVRADIA